MYLLLNCDRMAILSVRMRMIICTTLKVWTVESPREFVCLDFYFFRQHAQAASSFFYDFLTKNAARSVCVFVNNYRNIFLRQTRVLIC